MSDIEYKNDGLHVNSAFELQGTRQDTIDNPEWIKVLTDTQDRLIVGVRKDGSVYINKIDGVTEEIDWWRNYFNQHFTNSAYFRNKYKAPKLYAACRYGYASGIKDFQVCIVSDTHANDVCIENAIDCTDKFQSIDALIHLGDIEMWAPKDTYSSGYSTNGLKNLISNILPKCNKPWYVVCGNHDVGPSKYLYYTRTHKEVYEDIIAPMITNGCLKSGEYNNSGDYADRCYYYHDFASRKVRLIVLYEYGMPLELDNNDYWEPITYNASLNYIQPNTTYTYDANNSIELNCGGYTEHSFRLKATVTTTNRPNIDRLGGTWPQYKTRSMRIFTKNQMDWFVNVLNTTPNNYGIVIATHQPALRNVTLTNNRFSIGINPSNPYNPRQNRPATDDYMDKDIVADIINAWQNKEANFSEKVAVRTDSSLIETTGQHGEYLNTLVDDDYHYYFEVTADFSARTNTNAYFAGYLSGHDHVDMIEQKTAYPTQYNVIVCSSAETTKIVSGNDLCVINDTDSVAYDNLTIFSCRKDAIALSRIGNDKTVYGIDRDFEIININN